ncbi:MULTISPECIES: hypothetical protein [unclassified Candidatus Tisiphia]|uniref:hypothetical protein n=1 Tax=unclassified Candidatus Tisiphia TaxID=2996318 RepID=UPI00312CB3E5
MQRKNDLLLIICLAFSHVAIAKDFGKQAATFEIKEEGFVLILIIFQNRINNLIPTNDRPNTKLYHDTMLILF